MTIDVANIKPLRPYLLRAHYEWLVDNQLTPYILVNTTYPGIEVPMELAKNGEIVFNISMDALDSLSLGNDIITFNASFSGNPRHVSIPLGALIAIYARENNMGVGFPAEAFYENERKVLEAKQSLQVLNDNSKGEDSQVPVTRKKNSKKSNGSETLPAKETTPKKSNKSKKSSYLRIID